MSYTVYIAKSGCLCNGHCNLAAEYYNCFSQGAGKHHTVLSEMCLVAAKDFLRVKHGE